MNFRNDKLKETVDKVMFAASLGSTIFAGKMKEVVSEFLARVDTLSDADSAIDALLQAKAGMMRRAGMSEEEVKKTVSKQMKEKINNLFKKGEPNENS